MKPIQVLFDEALIAALKADEEVRRDGRSAVLRRAAAAYLRQQKRGRIAEQYRKAYSSRPGMGKDFDGWEEEGAWPEL